jgi:hypothetical protein
MGSTTEGSNHCWMLDLHVMEILICLTHTRDTEHKVQQDADHIDRVCWGDPKKCLEIERIQLANQELDETDKRKYVNARKEGTYFPSWT